MRRNPAVRPASARGKLPRPSTASCRPAEPRPKQRICSHVHRRRTPGDHCRRSRNPARASSPPTRACRPSPSDSTPWASSPRTRTAAPTARCCSRRRAPKQFLSGVILFEETLGQRADDGTPLPQVLVRRGIVPGIKVDKGTTALPGAPGDLITQGLDGLAERLKTYKTQGARFAKWREVYGVTDANPTPLGHRRQRRGARAVRRDLPERGHRPDRRARSADRRRSHDGAMPRRLRGGAARGVRRAAPARRAAGRHDPEAEHGAARQGPPAEGEPGAGGGGDGRGAATHRSRRGAHDQLPLRRPGRRGSDGQPQRNERDVPAMSRGCSRSRMRGRCRIR